MNQNDIKHAVAKAAINYVLPKTLPSDVLGIGTGSTANHFIELLADYKQAFAGAVASSTTSAQRLTELGIQVVDLNSVETLPFYIDGADESDAQLNLIKGGGAALTQEKIVAAVAKQFICIADASKWVTQLGAFALPVEVIPMARAHVLRELKRLGGSPVYRNNVVTDNGCDILDVHNLSIDAPAELETAINQIPGVVSNGLFAHRRADVLLLGGTDGVRIIYPPFAP